MELKLNISTDVIMIGLLLFLIIILAVIGFVEGNRIIDPVLYTFQLTNHNDHYWYVDAYNCLPYPSKLTKGLLSVRCIVPDPDLQHSMLIFDNVATVELISQVVTHATLSN